MALLDPWRPSSADPFDLPKAGHLLRRSGFGGSLRLRSRMVRMGVERAIATSIGGSVDESVGQLLEDAIALGSIERVRAFRIWRMLTGADRLGERMSYLWHDHFATSNQKLQDPAAMARQLDLFDRLGRGRFDDLVLAVARDPAMLRWLDNDTNIKGSPNENFARELFELFTLGLGAYSERDVQEAARAFTGWRVRDGRFYFDRRRHDDGVKEVFGKRGRFGGEDIVRMAVELPASARFVATKLLGFLVHPEPSKPEVEAVAGTYRAEGRHIGRTVERLLRSQLFFSQRAYRSRIKSPVEFAVGLVRDLGARAAPSDLARGTVRLGEALLEPPSVAGWPGHRHWLNPTAWRERSNFATRLLGRQFGKLRPAPDVILRERPADERAALAMRILLDGRVSDDGRHQIEKLADSRAARGEGGAVTLLQGVLALPEAWLM